MESLERAHRAKSQTPNEMPPMPLQATKADDLEADLKNKLNLKVNDRHRDSGVFLLKVQFNSYHLKT